MLWFCLNSCLSFVFALGCLSYMLKLSGTLLILLNIFKFSSVFECTFKLLSIFWALSRFWAFPRFRAFQAFEPDWIAWLNRKKPCGYALRSANTGLLEEKPLNTPGQKSTRPRQFALLAPKLWNKLPIALRTTDSLPRFRRDLKTHLFTLHFSP